MSTATGVRVAAMQPEHATAVLSIYRLGVDEHNATLRTPQPGHQLSRQADCFTSTR
ncbi:hypothetical protein [Streptomyces sp. NPDC055886]